MKLTYIKNGRETFINHAIKLCASLFKDEDMRGLLSDDFIKRHTDRSWVENL